MKRMLSVICICALLCAWGLPCRAEAAYEYEIIDGEVTILSWDSNAVGVASVPDHIDGCPVTAIGEFAFSMCESLTEVSLPESVEVIADGAFWHCTNLQSIHMPTTAKEVGFSAFAYCASLEELRIPDGVTVLPENLFLLCEGLQHVTIPNSVTEIEPFAFNQCSGLQEVEIPAGVTEIRQATFAFCTSLTKVVLPDSLTTIGANAFYGCYNLKYLAAPEVFDFLDSLTGFNVSLLQGAVLPTALTTLDVGAFAYCYDLWYLVFPGEAPSFGETCFEGIYPSVYYHAGDATWTEDVKQNYGGGPMWFGIHAYFTYTPDGNATCTTDGTKTSKCELCDATDTVTDEGSKGHQYVDGICTRCGDSEYGLRGDVNGDGKVNMKDWNRLYDHISEINPLTDDALQRADVTGDGKVNMKDWNRLYDHISEINPLF